MSGKAKTKANVRELLEAVVSQLNELNVRVGKIEVCAVELRRLNDNFENFAKHLIEKGIVTRAR